MLKLRWGILVIGLVVCVGTAQAWTGFTSVVSRLADFQTPSGGFRGTDGKPSTEATANALLLASLYGLRNKINTTEASKFITSVANSDGGYAPTPGAPSDVESVRNALLSLQHLGGKPSNPGNVLNYIKSLLDGNNNLFALHSGEKGAIKGTAFALQSIDLLGELKQKWVQDTLPKIKEVLEKHRQANVFYFTFPEDTISHVSANYYGIAVGNYVGFEFGAPEKWAKYITELQSPAGQFYDNVEKKVYSLASTAHAIYSLSTLGGLKGAQRFVDDINVDSLKAGVHHIASDIASAAHAHSALALTKAFKDFFHTVVNYEGADPSSGYVIEGSKLKPSLSLSTLFGGNNAQPHGGFDISSSTSFHGKEATKGKLTWDQELQRYVGEHLPTVGNFGPVKLLFSLVHKVAGLGDLSFNLDDTKNIGYGLTVVPKASQDGRDIREGESVSVGTDFKFAVSLHNKENDNLQSGDFVVSFTVLDSSHVAIHRSRVEGPTNKGPILFSYNLGTAALPSGQLAFRFEVSGKGAPHTTRTLGYQYAAPLVASNIQFAGITKGQAPVFKLGDKVKVIIEPASFPDLRNTHVLAHKDEGGNDISESRHFLMDIKSTQGTLIRSISSTAIKGTSKYTFEATIEATLDSIGTSVLSFRYIPAVGEEVALQNYDSATNELYEDVHVLSYTVRADLALEVVEAPKAGNIFYGSTVGYKFHVKDSISGQHVYVGEKSLANVFLDLQHEEAGSRPYTSIHHPATVVGEAKNKAFSIDWLVNPNAVRGAGALSLSVVDADGNAIPLKDSKPLKVSVGGDIEVEPHTYTTSMHTTRHSAIVAEFGLSCNNKTLKGADLQCNVVRDGAVVATLPVAHHNGRYTVSWTAPHKQIPSANYVLQFFRNSDRTRTQEKKEQREKRERKEKLLRGESATSTPAADEEFNLQPLFVVDVSYTAPGMVSLPVRAEFLAVSVLTAFLVWLSFKKTNPK